MKISIRLATFDDIELIEKLMKRSMKTLGKGYYSEPQIDACLQFVCVPDRQLIEDQTYFVVFTKEGIMVGCGGWSFRNTLYAGPKNNPQKNSMLNPAIDYARIRAMFIDPDYSGKGIGSKILDLSEKAAKTYGFSKGTLGATLSGFDFYKAKGWTTVGEEKAVLPNGIAIGVIKMEKQL